MPPLRVALVDKAGGRHVNVELPDDVPLEGLVPALANKLGLPQGTYTLTIKGATAPLPGGRSLADAGVPGGATLHLEQLALQVSTVEAEPQLEPAAESREALAPSPNGKPPPPAGKQRCTARTAAGNPCKAWAVRGSNPPLCAAHGGRPVTSGQAHQGAETPAAAPSGSTELFAGQRIFLLFFGLVVGGLGAWGMIEAVQSMRDSSIGILFGIIGVAFTGLFVLAGVGMLLQAITGKEG